MRLLQFFDFAVVIIQALRCFELTVSLLVFELRLEVFQFLLGGRKCLILVLPRLFILVNLLLHLLDLLSALILLIFAD